MLGWLSKILPGKPSGIVKANIDMAKEIAAMNDIDLDSLDPGAAYPDSVSQFTFPKPPQDQALSD